MAPKRTLLIVDDHPVFREGIVRIIAHEKDLAVAAVAADAADALAKAEASKPDLALIDISLEGMGGIDLAKSLRDRYPGMRLLILSMHPESLHAERALRAGANGYIMKRESPPQILAAVRHVLEGKIYVSREMNELILQRTSGGAGAGSSEVDALSDRELEVFRLLGQGLSTRRIADQLNISAKTVATHRDHIKEKLHIGDSSRLLQRAINWVQNEKPSS